MAEPTPQAQSDFLESLRQRWSQLVGQRPAQAAPAPAAAPTPVPVVTSGAAQAPTERPSLLETLRENVSDMVRPQPTDADRLAALGAGMLSNTRSRAGFFGDLAAGIQAQQQFDTRAREERLKGIEAQARIADQERRALMEKAKFAEETNPESLQGRERLARIRAYEAQAGAANRPQYQVVGTDAQGNAVVVDLRDPTRTRTLEGVRPTRSEVADIAAQGRNRALAERSADSDVRNLQAQMNAGDVRRNQLPPGGLEQYREERIQYHMRRLAAGAGAGTPEPGAGGGQGTAGGTVRLPGL
jgi:hypothetical protein